MYGASLIILYTMSTLYHAITNTRAKAFFRIMDHNTIFFLIAGTYTPITLVALRGALGWVLFGVVWGAAVLGIVLNSIDLERFRKPSVVCYIAELTTPQASEYSAARTTSTAVPAMESRLPTPWVTELNISSPREKIACLTE